MRTRFRKPAGASALLIAATAALSLGLVACGGQAAGDPADQATAARQSALDNRQTQLDQRTDELAARSQQLAAETLSLEEKTRLLADREAALADREKQLSRRAAQLDERAAAVSTNESRLIDERRQLDSRADETAAERAALDAAQAKLDAELRQQPARAWAEAELPTGTELAVELVGTLSSATSQAGESFHGRVTRDVRSADGLLVVPAGSLLEGVVDEVVAAQKIGGQASLALRFDTVALPSGQRIPIRAALSRLGRDTGGRDAATIGGAAAGGAILGRILGHDRQKGTLIGAVVGAAAGTAAAANRSGDDVVLPAGSAFTVRLQEPVAVQLPWTPRPPGGR